MLIFRIMRIYKIKQRSILYLSHVGEANLSLQGLDDEGHGRSLFYCHFSVGLRGLWMSIHWVNVPADHTRCEIHWWPGTIKSSTYKSLVRTFLWHLTFAMWGNISSPNWRKQLAHTCACSRGCMLVLPFQLRFSAV